VIVIAGGDRIPADVIDQLPAGALVVAADSGVDHAAALGLRVDVAIGDFDSVTAAGLARAEDEGATVIRHPVAKDHTDLELAIDAALAFEPTEIVVVGGHGGRLDHLLANALLLAAPRLGRTPVTAHWGPARLHVRHGPDDVELRGRPGELVTLLPMHGAAIGVRTQGLRYPLCGEDLPAATTRGVSNVLVDVHAIVGLDAGTLLIVLPGDLEQGAGT
jgi:thiamine pyrophosphokinase